MKIETFKKWELAAHCQEDAAAGSNPFFSILYLNKGRDLCIQIGKSLENCYFYHTPTIGH